jgi:hypothetical protein
MASYKVPATPAERIADFDKLVTEFKLEYGLLTEKQKKVSGHRARKALLSIAKLSRFVRKDIQEIIPAISKGEKEPKV